MFGQPFLRTLPAVSPAIPLANFLDTVHQISGFTYRAPEEIGKLINNIKLLRKQVDFLDINKRSATKDIFPEYHDIAAGGVLKKGETKEQLNSIHLSKVRWRL